MPTIFTAVAHLEHAARAGLAEPRWVPRRRRAQMTVELRGITWGHERGTDPLVATAARFAAETGTTVHWDVRSLQGFADASIPELAHRYDLLVYDHPHIGEIVPTGALLALDGLVDDAFIADQAANSVGPSHRSYEWDGHLWGLAIDAAGHVGAYRPDLLSRLGVGLPETWDDVFALAALAGSQDMRVSLPMQKVDTLATWLTLAANAGVDPYQDEERILPRDVGLEQLETLVRLAELSPADAYEWNPIRLLEHMATADDVIGCPVLFGYSNYSRPGFRPNARAVPPDPLGRPRPARRRDRRRRHRHLRRTPASPDAAVAYSTYVASPEIQRTLYVESGGQPGHRSAWLDDAANELATGFFRDTLPGLDAGYLRPRYDGQLMVQNEGGDITWELPQDRRRPGRAARPARRALPALARRHACLTTRHAAPGRRSSSSPTSSRSPSCPARAATSSRRSTAARASTCMARAPWGYGRPPVTWTNSAERFIEAYSGGWQVLLPNGGDAADEHGVEWGFHGEAGHHPVAHRRARPVVRAPLDLADHGAARAGARAARLRARRSRSSSACSNASDERDRRDVGPPPRVRRAADRAGRDDRAALRAASSPTTARRAPGSQPGARSAWPHAALEDGGTIDLSVIPPLDEPRSVLGYLTDFEVGEYTIANARIGLSATLRWPHELFPHAWFWQELHGLARLPLVPPHVHAGGRAGHHLPRAGHRAGARARRRAADARGRRDARGAARARPRRRLIPGSIPRCSWRCVHMAGYL